VVFLKSSKLDTYDLKRKYFEFFYFFDEVHDGYKGKIIVIYYVVGKAEIISQKILVCSGSIHSPE
jgi:hypothetical protein